MYCRVVPARFAQWKFNGGAGRPCGCNTSRLAIVRGTWETLLVLIGLFPELDAPGGVQRAGRHLAAVLTEFASSHSMDCRLISLNDSPELHRMTIGEREFVFTGSRHATGG